jgi:hypothetical protein
MSARTLSRGMLSPGSRRVLGLGAALIAASGLDLRRAEPLELGIDLGERHLAGRLTSAAARVSRRAEPTVELGQCSRRLHPRRLRCGLVSGDRLERLSNKVAAVFIFSFHASPFVICRRRSKASSSARHARPSPCRAASKASTSRARALVLMASRNISSRASSSGASSAAAMAARVSAFLAVRRPRFFRLSEPSSLGVR